MIEKYFDLGGYANAADWGNGYTYIHGPTMEKVATSGFIPVTLSEKIEQIKPRPEGRYILLNALGAYEFWGSNANGDAFPEWSLKSQPPPDAIRKFVDTKVREKMPFFTIPPTTDYGGETFVRYAKVYQNHINKDPLIACGDVTASAYNEVMHRVELIVFIYNERAPDIIKVIDEGGYIPFSMGAKLPFDVCLYPGTPINTPNGFTPIEKLKVGDEVVSHRGINRKIHKTFERKYSGVIKTIKVKGTPDPFSLTENHPIFSISADNMRTCGGSANGLHRRHTFENGYCRVCDTAVDDLYPDFIESGKLRVGDYVAIPKVRLTNLEPMSEALASLCGYYLGDGHIIVQKSRKDAALTYAGLGFTCHFKEREHINRLKTTIQCLTESPVYEYPAGSGRNAVVLVVHDQILAAEVAELCGHKKDKHLPGRIFASGREAQLELLAGLVDTDGCVDKKKKSLRFSNTNAVLVKQVQLLSATLGIPATLSGGKPIETTYGPTSAYQVNLGTAGTIALEACSQKCALAGAKERWSATASVIEDYVWFPIDTIETTIVENVTVHNLAVEADESYLVNNIAVHNCSICGNVSKSRPEYCDHLKTQLKQFLPDGRKVFSYNYFPRFFDISKVGVPADRSAWMLRKVASVEAPPRMVKKSSIEKREPVTQSENLGSAPIDPKLLKFLKDSVGADSCCANDTPLDPQMDLLKKQYDAKDILASMLMLGMLPSNSEVNTLTNGGSEQLPDKLDLVNPNRRLIMILSTRAPDRSMLEPHFTKRAVRLRNRLEKTAGSSVSKAFSELLSTLDLKQLAATIDSNPVIKLAVNDASLEEALFKTSATKHPCWLPFFVGINSYMENSHA